MVNQESGLLGVSEISSDMQRLARAGRQRHARGGGSGAVLLSGKKWIGSFAAALGGLDTLVFAGGIGESAPAHPGTNLRRAWSFSASNSDLQTQCGKRVCHLARTMPACRCGSFHTDEELMIAKSVAARSATTKLENNYEEHRPSHPNCCKRSTPTGGRRIISRSARFISSIIRF